VEGNPSTEVRENGEPSVEPPRLGLDLERARDRTPPWRRGERRKEYGMALGSYGYPGRMSNPVFGKSFLRTAGV